MARSPFDKNYGQLSLGYSQRHDWGLSLRIRPRDWFRTFWSHPEADVIWYCVGPFAFYTTGRWHDRRAVRQFLWSKYYKTTTKEGAHVVAVALNLQRQYPNLSGPELIRLAYWGASGSTED